MGCRSIYYCRFKWNTYNIFKTPIGGLEVKRIYPPFWYYRKLNFKHVPILPLFPEITACGCYILYLRINRIIATARVDSAQQTACCGCVAGGHLWYRRKGKRLRSTLPRGYGRLAMHLGTFVSAALRDARQRPRSISTSPLCAPPRLPVPFVPAQSFTASVVVRSKFSVSFSLYTQ